MKKLLNVMVFSLQRFEKKIHDDHPDKDNFFSIIESSKELLANNNWWQIKEKGKNMGI